MREEIERTRKELDSMLESGSLLCDKVIAVSRKLDRLILKYYLFQRLDESICGIYLEDQVS